MSISNKAHEAAFPYLYIVNPVERPLGDRAPLANPASHALELLVRKYGRGDDEVSYQINDTEMMRFFRSRTVEASRPSLSRANAALIDTQFLVVGKDCALYPRLIKFKTGCDLCREQMECLNHGVFFHYLCTNFPYLTAPALESHCQLEYHSAKSAFRTGLIGLYKKLAGNQSERIAAGNELVQEYKDSIRKTRIVGILVEEKPEINDDLSYGDGSVWQYWAYKLWCVDKQTDPDELTADAPKPTVDMEPANAEDYQLEFHLQLIDPTGVMRGSECRMGSWLHNCLGGVLHDPIGPGEFGIPLPDPDLDVVFNCYRVIATLLESNWVDSSAVPFIGPIEKREYESRDTEYWENFNDLVRVTYARGTGYKQLLMEKMYYTLDLNDIAWCNAGDKANLEKRIPGWNTKTPSPKPNSTSKKSKRDISTNSKGKTLCDKSQPVAGTSAQMFKAQGVYFPPAADAVNSAPPPVIAPPVVNQVPLAGCSNQIQPMYVDTGVNRQIGEFSNLPLSPFQMAQVPSPNYGQFQEPTTSALYTTRMPNLPTDGEVLWERDNTKISWNEAENNCRVNMPVEYGMDNTTAIQPVSIIPPPDSGPVVPPPPLKRQKRGQTEHHDQGLIIPAPNHGGRTLRSRATRNKLDNDRLAHEDAS